jgi:DNA-binding NarL/FixJ family response regulator
MSRILVVSDNRLYRDGLALSFQLHEPSATIVSTGSEEETCRCLSQEPADVILIDLDMKDAATTLNVVSQLCNGAPVIALGVGDADDEIVSAAEAGAAAFVTRNGSISDLLDTIQAVVRGELKCSPRIARLMSARLSYLASRCVAPGRVMNLSARETEILKLVERGLSNKQIARELGLEVATIKNHMHNILGKLRVTRRGEAAAFVRRFTPVPQQGSRRLLT